MNQDNQKWTATKTDKSPKKNPKCMSNQTLLLLLLLLMLFIWHKFEYVQPVRHVGCCVFMLSEKFSAVSETQRVTCAITILLRYFTLLHESNQITSWGFFAILIDRWKPVSRPWSMGISTCPSTRKRGTEDGSWFKVTLFCTHLKPIRCVSCYSQCTVKPLILAALNFGD